MLGQGPSDGLGGRGVTDAMRSSRDDEALSSRLAPAQFVVTTRRPCLAFELGNFSQDRAPDALLATFEAVALNCNNGSARGFGEPDVPTFHDRTRRLHRARYAVRLPS